MTKTHESIQRNNIGTGLSVLVGAVGLPTAIKLIAGGNPLVGLMIAGVTIYTGYKLNNLEPTDQLITNHTHEFSDKEEAKKYLNLLLNNNKDNNPAAKHF